MYALLLVLIVIVGIVAWKTLGASVSTRVDEVNNTIGAAGSGVDQPIAVEDNAEVNTTSDDTGTVPDDSEPTGSQPEGISAIKEKPVAHGDE